MSPLCSSSHAQIISAQITLSWNTVRHFPSSRSLLAFKSLSAEHLSQRVVHTQSKLSTHGSFLGGSRIVTLTDAARIKYHRKGSSVSACWLTTSQIATNAFTLGTISVLPFYTLMIAAPKSQLTKRTMESSIPYVALGILYAYLLYLSWSPETLRLMFASKYWLPELPGITKMFSNETTVSSAWIHLLAVDLFAASQVFHDGIKNKVETRHSISLCLLFCPIGIATHAITKVLARSKDGRSH